MQLASKTKTNRSLICAAVAAALLAGTSAASANCQNVIQGHVDWAEGVVPPENRTLSLTMVSNHAPAFDSPTTFTTREVTYTNAALNPGQGWFANTLIGNPSLLYNDRQWIEDCDGWFCPQHPFNPNQSETWLTVLNPSNSIMTLAKSGDSRLVNLSCDNAGFLEGYYTTYQQIGQFQWPIKTRKYVLSIERHSYTIN